MLVALSVLPIATFTTITVLGGGAIAVPRWMQDPASKLVEIEESSNENNEFGNFQSFSELKSTGNKQEKIIEEENLEIEIIENTPTGGFSGWVASQVVEKIEARTRKKE